MAFIDDSLITFEDQLAKISKIIEAQMLALLADYDSLGGDILNNNHNKAMVSSFSTEFNKILKEAGYGDLVKDFAASSDSTVLEYQKLTVGTAIPLSFTKTDMATFKTLEKIDLSEMFNIGNQAGMTLQTDLMADVLSGQPIKDIKKQLVAVLDDKLKRYADTYMTTSRNRLLQTAEIAGVDNPKAVAWRYTGPRDNKNREECVLGLDKKIFTYEEMLEFEEFWGLRWNCRHIFTAVPKKNLKEAA